MFDEKVFMESVNLYRELQNPLIDKEGIKYVFQNLNAVSNINFRECETDYDPTDLVFVEEFGLSTLKDMLFRIIDAILKFLGLRKEYSTAAKSSTDMEVVRNINDADRMKGEDEAKDFSDLDIKVIRTLEEFLKLIEAEGYLTKSKVLRDITMMLLKDSYLLESITFSNIPGGQMTVNIYPSNLEYESKDDILLTQTCATLIKEASPLLTDKPAEFYYIFPFSKKREITYLGKAKHDNTLNIRNMSLSKKNIYSDLTVDKIQELFDTIEWYCTTDYFSTLFATIDFKAKINAIKNDADALNFYSALVRATNKMKGDVGRLVKLREDLIKSYVKGLEKEFKIKIATSKHI